MNALYRYFYLSHDVFAGITDVDFSNAEDLYQKLIEDGLSARCYDMDYIKRRLSTEEIIRSEFIRKGGKVQKKHPYYLTLGNCDSWFYDKKRCFGSLNFPITEFDIDSISFTYGDSIPTYMEQFQDGKEYRKKVYTYDEIIEIIKKYGYPQKWNKYGKLGPETYIEAQVWCEKPINEFRESKIIEQCGVELFCEKFSEAIIRANPNFINEKAQKKLSEFLSLIKKNNLWSWYCSFVDSLDENKFCLDSVHGIEHAWKCSLLAFIMADMIKMGKNELKALVIAATYHDIGRKFNIEGKTHGEISAEMLPSTLFGYRSKEYENVQYAIMNHENRAVKRQTELLSRLQDIDSLDYMRLGFRKYSNKFLITEESKLLIRTCLELNISMFYDRFYIKNLIKGGI